MAGNEMVLEIEVAATFFEGDDGAEASSLNGAPWDDGGRLYDLRPSWVAVSNVMSERMDSRTGAAGRGTRERSCKPSLALALESASM